jgi:thiol-disulfide isomerase/thioredoxin
MLSDLVRLAWAVGIIGAGFALFRLVSFLIVKRAQTSAKNQQLIHPGKPTILYFTSPDCAPCRTVQLPALHKVKSRLGDNLQVIEVDAVEQPDLARQWGVLSVPTTFIIDASGKPRHVNHGVTSAEGLMEQLNKYVN